MECSKMAPNITSHSVSQNNPEIPLELPQSPYSLECWKKQAITQATNVLTTTTFL